MHHPAANVTRGFGPTRKIYIAQTNKPHPLMGAAQFGA